MNQLISEQSFRNIVNRPIDNDLKTLEESDLSAISAGMVEVDRATASFGKTQSQYMDRIMTLTSLSPMRNLRQILAEIEKRRSALREAEIKFMRQKLKYEQTKKLLTNETDPDRIAELKIDQYEIEGQLSASMLYVEGALKTIYAYQAAYDEIRQTYGIDNWDELDFEKAEERHHIMKAFEQASAVFQATGTIDAGNHEYFRQIGVHPMTAQVDLATYFRKVDEQIQKGEAPNIDSFNEFLMQMAERHKGCSQRMIAAKGMLTGAFEKALYKEGKK